MIYGKTGYQGKRKPPKNPYANIPTEGELTHREIKGTFVPEVPASALTAAGVSPSTTRPRTRTTLPLSPTSPLLSAVSALLSPPTASSPREIAEAAHRLGVEPLTDAANGVGHDITQGLKAVADLPKTHVDSPEILGTPTAAQIVSAAQRGATARNQKGKLTIPATRQAARQLKAAREAVAKDKGGRLPILAEYGPEAERNARTVLGIGRKRGESGKSLLSSLVTGIQESGFENLPIKGPGGGWRQEETAFYPPSSITNVKKGARNYFNELDELPGKGQNLSIADLAQAVQGSGAGPSFYAQHAGEAEKILHAYNQGHASPVELQQLKGAEANAQRLGIPVANAKEAASLGPPAPKVVSRYQAANAAADQLEKLGLPYVWGGGHNAGQVNLGSGVDCSGAVSYVLQKMGVKLPGGVVSGDMGQYLEPGSGAVTVFYNGEHTFMRIGNRYFGTSTTNPGGGAGFIDRSVAEGEVASGNEQGAYNVAHVPGLGRKVALQLGVPTTTAGGTTTSQPFPGMTVSEGGTTAQVNPGAAKTQTRPGFSAVPILAGSGNGLLQPLSLAPTPGAPGEAEEAAQETLARIFGKRRL